MSDFKRFQKRLQESALTCPFYPIVSSFTNISPSSLKKVSGISDQLMKGSLLGTDEEEWNSY